MIIIIKPASAILFDTFKRPQGANIDRMLLPSVFSTGLKI